MATRLYFESSGTPGLTTPPVHTFWSGTTTAPPHIQLRGPMTTTKAGTAMTTLSVTGDASTANLGHVIYQGIYGPLAAQTIDPTLGCEFQIRASETSTDNNLFVAISIRILQPDGSVRAELVAGSGNGVDNNEVATSLTNRRIGMTPASQSGVASSGDYLVIEIGLSGDPAAGGSHNGSLRVGTASADDLPPLDDASTDDYAPWVEFTDTIALNATGAATSTLAPLTSAASGHQSTTGAAASSLAPATAAASGYMKPVGAIASSLAPATSSVLGVHAGFQGSATTTLQPLTSAATGAVPYVGELEPSLQPLTASLSGVMHPRGAIAATLAPLSAAGVGRNDFLARPDLVMSAGVAVRQNVGGAAAGTSMSIAGTYDEGEDDYDHGMYDFDSIQTGFRMGTGSVVVR